MDGVHDHGRRPGGSGTTVVLTLEDVALGAGTVYSVYAVGLLTGEPALEALVAVDQP